MRLSPWGRAVAVSALVVLGAAGVLAVGALASRHARLVSYPVGGELQGMSLDLGGADVQIVGGGARERMTVQWLERYAFGHDARTARTVAGGVLHVVSRCPAAL